MAHTQQKIVIKSCWINNSVLYETTATDLTAATVEAVSRGANLRGAKLYGANLRGAKLRGANLYGADLYGANLRGANLYGANLRGANLYGAKLYGADLRGANLYGADLRGANLYGADLYGANLRGAKLRGANLYGADLRGADLYGANLYGADLRGAKLRGAKNVDAWHSTPLLMLLDQPGPIRAYKLVDSQMRSPMQTTGRLTYKVGQTKEVKNANTDVSVDCGAGINVATWDWIAKEWQEGWRVLVVEFTAADIAAIPTGTDGKFRLWRCRVVDEVTDLASRGIGVKVDEAAVSA